MLESGACQDGCIRLEINIVTIVLLASGPKK